MKKESFWAIGILLIVTFLFFYQMLFFGKVPFPGDGLMSDFQPWRSASYLGYAPGGVPNKAQYPDVYRQLYPWKTQAITSLKQGKLPLWNPYNFSGSPLLANFQSAALYPLNIIYVFFNQIISWSILVLLQPFLAALFTYWYARKVGMKPYGSMLTAISYGFSGFMTVWLEYNTVGQVILWLPLILLAIENNWFGLLAFSYAAALLAGHPQVFGYLFVFTSIYAFFRSKHKMLVFVFSLLGIGIAGIQLIPGIELIANAARSRHEFSNLFTKILIQPWQLLSMVIPNIFGNPATRTYWPTDTFVGKVTTIGLVPLFFLPSVLRTNSSIKKWFLWSTIIVLLLITANPITFFLYRIPMSSSPTLMTFLLSFSLAMLCGLGLDYWITDRHSLRKLLRRSLEMAALFFVLWLFQHSNTASRALLYGGIITTATLGLFYAFTTQSKLKNAALIALLMLHVADQWMFFTKFNPFVPVQFVFPSHPVLTFLKEHSPDRYWGYATAGIAANFATQYQIFSPEGYDPLYPKWYGQFVYQTPTFNNSTRSDAAISSYFGDGGMSNNTKQKMLSALSVRYILDRNENGSTEQTFPPKLFKQIYSFEDWRIYENLNASPRAYIKTGTATILTYEPERVVIKTETTTPADLVLTDTYYPGWRATVDDASVDVRRFNNTFRQVSVPSGSHTVVMTYEPDSVKYGLIISMISILLTIIFMRLV